MSVTPAPYHAHVYFDAASRYAATHLHRFCAEATADDAPARVIYVGPMRERPVGPHPQPQFEIHFHEDALPAMLALLEASGLTALVHPLTDDDLADHTTLARWIGTPVALDLSVLDPPGVNQGVARFGKTDF
jgi:aromatic ring-cleaving dioxygenase